jgi:hypothetical protein
MSQYSIGNLLQPLGNPGDSSAAAAGHALDSPHDCFEASMRPIAALRSTPDAPCRDLQPSPGLAPAGRVGQMAQNWNGATETVILPSDGCWTVKLTCFEAFVSPTVTEIEPLHFNVRLSSLVDVVTIFSPRIYSGCCFDFSASELASLDFAIFGFLAAYSTSALLWSSETVWSTVTRMARRGLSVNEVVRALKSMMVRSKTAPIRGRIHGCKTAAANSRPRTEALTHPVRLRAGTTALRRFVQ